MYLITIRFLLSTVLQIETFYFQIIYNTINLIKNTLIDHNYPFILKNKIIYKTKNHIINKTHIPHRDINNSFTDTTMSYHNCKFIKLPYHQTFEKHTRHILKGFKFVPAQYSISSTVCLLFKLHDPTDKSMLSGEYRIKCLECTYFYLDETSQYLKKVISALSLHQKKFT